MWLSRRASSHLPLRKPKGRSMPSSRPCRPETRHAEIDRSDASHGTSQTALSELAQGARKGLTERGANCRESQRSVLACGPPRVLQSPAGLPVHFSSSVLSRSARSRFIC